MLMMRGWYRKEVKNKSTTEVSSKEAKTQRLIEEMLSVKVRLFTTRSLKG